MGAIDLEGDAEITVNVTEAQVVGDGFAMGLRQPDVEEADLKMDGAVQRKAAEIGYLGDRHGSYYGRRAISRCSGIRIRSSPDTTNTPKIVRPRR